MEALETTSTEQELSGIVRHPPLSGLLPVSMSLGAKAGRACVLTAVYGYLGTEAWSTYDGSVRIVENGANWELQVTPSIPGERLSAAATCFNTPSVSVEKFWNANAANVKLESYASNRRCFLTSLTTRLYGFTHGGFREWTDNVEITSNTSGFYLGGSQSGSARAGARCMQVTSQLSNTLFFAAFNPGIISVEDSTLLTGSACGLTRIFGRLVGLTPGDPNHPGPRIEPFGNHYRMTAINETGGRAICVN